MDANNAINVYENVVGVRVENIQDVVQAQAAGLLITNENGYGYDNHIIEDEKDGVEREPTEQEVFERIAKDINEGNKVYACMILSHDLCVMKDTNTIIQSDFYVGQKVYTMHENKIMKGEIRYLSLSRGVLNGDAQNALLGEMAEKLYYYIGFSFTNGRTPKIGSEKDEIINKIHSLAKDNYAVLKTDKGDYLSRHTGEIFATKDALVENLTKDYIK